MNRAIDVHVHLVALADGGNGCYLSLKLRKSPLFRYLAWREGFDLERPELANLAYTERLKLAIGRSEAVRQAVVLGMDGVYDDRGELDLSHTEFLISNRYVLEVCRKDPDYFLPGVSINPRRRDALDEVERSAAHGAVLVKVLPNAQRFDPSDRRYIPFYRALARHRMPLLSHAGCEFTLTGKDQSAGDPRRLQVALEAGVLVIAAHACSYGLFFSEPYLGVLKEFARRYPRFYADTSALTLPNRVRALFLLRRLPELHDRLIFGTDYPLPVFSYPVLGTAYMRARNAPTAFDRHAVVLERLGIHVKDFSSIRQQLAV